MEQQGLIHRKRSEKDERMVLFQLTGKGIKLQEKAARIPEELVKRLSDSELKSDDLIELKEKLNAVILFLSK